MAHCSMEFSSEALQMVTSLKVILPEDTDPKKARVLYLLHGLFDNNSGWVRYTSIERYVRPYGVAVVIPEVQRSYYTDMAHGPAYFSYVSKELPRVCRKFFGLSTKKENNYLMGLSMGGYGALKCAFAYATHYEAVSVLSSVTDIVSRIEAADAAQRAEYQAIFGMNLEVKKRDDLLLLLKETDPASFPRLYMYCGEEDELYSQNAAFYKTAKRRGMNVAFSHWKGAHDWNFWDEAAKRAVKEMFGG